MKRTILQVACPQFDQNNTVLTNTTASIPLLTSILRGCLPVNVSSLPVYVELIESDKETDVNTDLGALMYIVTVLLMYSCGIFFMIMKNLKREKHALEEERTLDDFFRGIPVSEKEREKDNVNRVAIQAFYTMTSCKLQDLNKMPIMDQQTLNSTSLCYSVDTIPEDEDEENEELEDYDSDSNSNSDTEITEDCIKSQIITNSNVNG
ncbi:uncharacterized protein LOC123523578 [Mercenaria mercenaria]|uniref:uncharacterized protein LOC123523578 n=1 Tax=Mercenaria mercenaria TaxID=6596 RepID=UPI00234EC60F|nr:uncharacterized protein LOC123523578 [Mercenaria mercenaria]